jgi:hypothetical protein
MVAEGLQGEFVVSPVKAPLREDPFWPGEMLATRSWDPKF